MNNILENLSAPAWTNVVIALLHSLWLGVAWAVGLGVFLRFNRSPRVRYAAGLLAMTGLLLSAFAAWAIVSRDWTGIPPAVVQVASGPQPSDGTHSSVFEFVAQHGDTVSPAPFFRWTAFAAAGWLAGLGVMFVRLVLTLAGASQVRRESKPVLDSGMLDILEGLRQTLRIKRLVKLAASARVHAPCVCGLLAPTILFPASMLSGMSPEQLRAILAHELAHIRRHDFLVNILQQIIEALLFFNPAVWWMNRQIRLEREACCDDIAVQAIASREMYTRTLSDVAELSVSSPSSKAQVQPAFPGESGPSSLLERMRRLLLPGYRPPVRLPWHSLIGVLMLSVILLSVIWQGSYWAVVVAAEILTPEQRIEQIANLAAGHVPEMRTYGDEDKVRISGRVRTEDNVVLKGGVRVHAHSEGLIQSFGYGGLKMKDSYFEDTLPYGRISLAVFGPEGYGPAFLDGLLPEPGGAITNLDIVLPKGFTTKVRIIDSNNRPLAGVQMEATYNHRAGSIPIKAVTDAQGEATLSNCVHTPLTFRAHVSGYQPAVHEDVRLNPNEPLVWMLEPARLTTGKVIARQTRQPVANATVKLLYRGPRLPMNHGYFQDAPVLARTDETGEFRLDSLADGTMHVLVIEAPGFAPQLARSVTAGQTGLNIELGPELTLEGEVRGDLSQLLRIPDPVIEVINPIQLTKNQTRMISRSVPVRIENGVGRFSVTGLMEGGTELKAGGKSTAVDMKESRTGFVIDLDPPVTNSPVLATRTIIVRFQTPIGAPPARGSLEMRNSTESDDFFTNSFVQITGGEARFEARCPGWVSWRMQGLIGYWAPEQRTLRIEEDSAALLVQLKAIPAGAIHGKVLGTDGSEVGGVLISVVQVKRPKEQSDSLGDVGKSSASSNDGPTKFVAQPLPLGGEYMLIAHRGQQMCASEIVSLNEKNPIREVALRFVEGKRLIGRVTDQVGLPVAGAKVKLDYVTPYSYGFRIADDVPTDNEGRVFFDRINPSLPGKFEIFVDDQPGFQPLRREISTFDEPVVLRLEPGLRISGVVLHAETGNPLAGAEVYAMPEKPDSTTQGYHRLNADARTDSEGRFVISSLSNRNYILHCRSGRIMNPTAKHGIEGIQCAAGEEKQVVIRLLPRQGARLTEGKAGASN